MKTKIFYNNLLLQEMNGRPNVLWPRLARHFSMTREGLHANGFVLLANRPLLSKEQVIEQCREPDGRVWGVRFFNIYPPGFLVSPTSHYVWETDTHEVPFFSNEAAVRGHHGCHAAWVEDLQDWSSTLEIDHHDTCCKALVIGYGDVIVGDQGWRSSKMKVMRIAIDHAYYNQIQPFEPHFKRRYPNVSIQSGYAQEQAFTFPRKLRQLGPACAANLMHDLLNEDEDVPL